MLEDSQDFFKELEEEPDVNIGKEVKKIVSLLKAEQTELKVASRRNQRCETILGTKMRNNRPRRKLAFRENSGHCCGQRSMIEKQVKVVPSRGLKYEQLLNSITKPCKRSLSQSPKSFNIPVDQSESYLDKERTFSSLLSSFVRRLSINDFGDDTIQYSKGARCRYARETKAVVLIQGLVKGFLCRKNHAMAKLILKAEAVLQKGTAKSLLSRSLRLWFIFCKKRRKVAFTLARLLGEKKIIGASEKTRLLALGGVLELALAQNRLLLQRRVLKALAKNVINSLKWTGISFPNIHRSKKKSSKEPTRINGKY